MGVQQRAVQVEIELVLIDGNQRQRVDGFVKVGKQATRKREGLLLETGGDAVVYDEIHTDFSKLTG